jgi:hypothetical protein
MNCQSFETFGPFESFEALANRSTTNASNHHGTGARSMFR